MDLTELKQQARAAATRRRRAAAEIDDGSAASAVGDLLLETLDVDPSAVASGYIPIGSELDVRSVLGRLRRRGHTIVLPSVREKGHPLVFREWVLGDPLVREPFGSSTATATGWATAAASTTGPWIGFGLGRR